MIDIPADVRIRAAIGPGCVYYFAAEEHVGTTPHFFVVLNCDPVSDEILVLCNSTSQVDKVRERTRHHPETFLVVSNEEYADFTAELSAFDGNEVLARSISELVGKMERGELVQRTTAYSARNRSTIPPQGDHPFR